MTADQAVDQVLNWYAASEETALYACGMKTRPVVPI